MSTETVKVPDIGGADEVEVIEICVALGDVISEDSALIVLESDKASMEVPSPLAGEVVAIHVAVGDSVSEGSPIVELRRESSAATDSAVAPAAAESAPEQEAPAPEQRRSDAGEAALLAVAVPDIGTDDAVDVIELCVGVGQQVQEGDALIVLESDKASMEVPSPASGTVAALALKVGDQVRQGSAILQLQTVASPSPAPLQSPQQPPEPKPQPKPEPESEAAASVAGTAALSAPPEERAATAAGAYYAGPAVRLLARELGVDLAQVSGSGPRGRIVKEDLQAYVKKRLSGAPAVAAATAGIPAIPAVDFAQFGAIELHKLSKMDKLTAANMQRSWLNVPHVTQFDDADISDLEAFRATLKKEAEGRGVKLTPLPFLLKACALALAAHPKFNSSLHSDGEHLVLKRYIHIGIAVDTPAGLVVPVVRDVDRKSIWALAAETAELAEKAKQRKLSPAQMQGGCFTISSLGGIGGQGFTPIVNAPEVAILGVSRLAVKPHWDGSAFVARKMLPLSLSYDHRVINGADAGRFFTELCKLLGDIRRMAL